MAVDERSRHKLYNRLQKLLREEEAVTLIDHLPPGGWPNLATKQDVLLLRQELLQQEGRLDSRMETMEGRLNSRMETMEGRFESRMETMEGRLDSKMGGLDSRMDTMESRLKAFTLRTVLITNFVSAVTVAGTVLAAVRLG